MAFEPAACGILAGKVTGLTIFFLFDACPLAQSKAEGLSFLLKGQGGLGPWLAGGQQSSGVKG